MVKVSKLISLRIYISILRANYIEHILDTKSSPCFNPSMDRFVIKLYNDQGKYIAEKSIFIFDDQATAEKTGCIAGKQLARDAMAVLGYKVGLKNEQGRST